MPLLWSALALPAPFSAEAGFGDNKAEAELPHSKSRAGIAGWRIPRGLGVCDRIVTLVASMVKSHTWQLTPGMRHRFPAGEQGD